MSGIGKYRLLLHKIANGRVLEVQYYLRRHWNKNRIPAGTMPVSQCELQGVDRGPWWLLYQQLLVQVGMLLCWKPASISLMWPKHFFKVRIGQWFRCLDRPINACAFGIRIMLVKSTGLKRITWMYLTIRTLCRTITWWIIKLSYNGGLHIICVWTL